MKKDRDIWQYEKEKYSVNSVCEKWGVEKRRGKPENKRVLFTGTGRCGTTYVTKLMAEVGLDVPHERVGKDGTASLFFLVDSDWHPMLPWAPGKIHVGERRSDYTFSKVVHLVRNPRKTIPSMQKIFVGLNYEYFEEAGVLDPELKGSLLKCMHLYYEMNLLAEAQAGFRIRLEDLAVGIGWRELLEYLGIKTVPFPKHIKRTNQGTGYRKSTPVDWGTLMDLDSSLATKIQKMAVKYGYSLKDDGDYRDG